MVSKTFALRNSTLTAFIAEKHSGWVCIASTVLAPCSWSRRYSNLGKDRYFLSREKHPTQPPMIIGVLTNGPFWETVSLTYSNKATLILQSPPSYLSKQSTSHSKKKRWVSQNELWIKVRRSILMAKDTMEWSVTNFLWKKLQTLLHIQGYHKGMVGFWKFNI